MLCFSLRHHVIILLDGIASTDRLLASPVLYIPVATWISRSCRITRTEPESHRTFYRSGRGHFCQAEASPPAAEPDTCDV